MKFKKLAAILIIVILLVLGVFYYISSSKTGRVADIKVYIEAKNDSVEKMNIEASLEKVSKVGVPVGGSMVLPGITLMVKKGMIPISDWYSVGYNGTGIYNLRVALDESFSENQPVIIYVQVVGSRGEKLISGQKELILKENK